MCPGAIQNRACDRIKNGKYSVNIVSGMVLEMEEYISKNNEGTFQPEEGDIPET